MTGPLERIQSALGGRYRIEREIGAGGMGVVYLAVDTRLERPVAVKTLPAQLIGDSDRLELLQREAKLLASLNHPHIATIHGLEESADGSFFIVLEYIEGETLAKRLQAGPLSLRDSLRFCRQIAEALETAHRAGIVHRDLKPANVMVIQHKRIKVLDFGIAKRVVESLPREEFDSITTTYPSLDPSRIAGTPGYASPEQLRGDELDTRTDLFAFGCVLYESLVGERAFPGSTSFDAIAATLSREPDWSRLPPETPKEIRKLLERCLAKDKGKRTYLAENLLESIDRALETRLGIGKQQPESMMGRQRIQLPKDLTSFVGREDALEECAGLFRNARLLTLTGSGGCGKTRLAIHLAKRLKDSFSDGVWFVDLSFVVDPNHVAQVMASALGLREEPGKKLSETMVDHLQPTNGLLLLDNCEHVLEAVANLTNTLLQSTEALSILTTSREALRLPSEQTYRVPSLTIPDGDSADVDAVREAEAVRLFVERASFVNSSFELSRGTAPVVVDICRHLDGIPLAIELAASQVRVLSVEDIGKRLDDRLRFLTSATRETVPRHQTLRAAIQWSYDHLTESEKTLFRQLAVFSGGWTIEEATAVCGKGHDDLEMLHSVTRLIDKSLVVMEGTPGSTTRYRMLETLGQFALEKLQDHGEEAPTRERHLAFFLNAGEEFESKLMGAQQGPTVAELEGDHENLLAALRWCEKVENGADKALQITAWLWRFWSARGYFSLGGEILGHVLSAQEDPAPSVYLVKTLNGAGLIAMFQGDFATAEMRYQQCLEVSRAIGDELRMAGAYNGLGAVAGYGRGDYKSARENFEKCLAIYRGLEDKRGTAIALLNIGEAAIRQGESSAAIPMLEESLALRRSIGDMQGIAGTLVVLSVALIRTGNRDLARRYLIEGLELIREHGLRHRGVDVLEVATEMAQEVNDFERSAMLLATATAARESLGTPRPPNELGEEKAILDSLKHHLGTERFQLAWQEGWELSLEDALVQTLAWLKGESGR